MSPSTVDAPVADQFSTDDEAAELSVSVFTLAAGIGNGGGSERNLYDSWPKLMNPLSKGSPENGGNGGGAADDGGGAC